MARKLGSEIEKVNAFEALLMLRKDKLGEVLPKHLTAERTIRLFCTSFAKNPTLRLCTQNSLLGAFMEACSLGLEVDCAGQSWLVPFKDNKSGRYKAQLIVGYKGLCALAYRSSLVRWIEARVVSQGDKFNYRYGSDRMLHHEVKLSAKPDRKLLGVYAQARLVGDDVPLFEVLGEADVQKHKRMARGSDRADSPWNTHTAEMWRKTAVRVMAKLLPSATEMQRAIELDETHESGRLQSFDIPEAMDIPFTREDDDEGEDNGDEEAPRRNAGAGEAPAGA